MLENMRWKKLPRQTSSKSFSLTIVVLSLQCNEKKNHPGQTPNDFLLSSLSPMQRTSATYTIEQILATIHMTYPSLLLKQKTEK
jgi:hypothetical protein